MGYSELKKPVKLNYIKMSIQIPNFLKKYNTNTLLVKHYGNDIIQN